MAAGEVGVAASHAAPREKTVDLLRCLGVF
jgi:hypothetical protein